MEENRVDARGLPCPQPVLLTRKALMELGEEGVVTVVVDSAASRDNVMRFAESQGCTVQVEEPEEGLWEIVLAKGFACGIPEKKKAAPGGDEEGRDGAGVVVYVNGPGMGRGDEELGEVLIKGFLGTLKEVEPLPTHLVFVNEGVRLTVEGSRVLEEIGGLEKKGVKVLSCAT
ncbi:MAG TPA: sulfurtransferase-like selenium metabolism protein YedF, partial [Planctomycetes bacterium]|nr:sulfurtransferase-like selenium metabolism protein YedF [Planctomycetota bacterium]